MQITKLELICVIWLARLFIYTHIYA